MSTKMGKRVVTHEEIERVKIMIEQCLLHYKTRKEVTDILYQYRKIEPGFTDIVWKRLEEENAEFFKAYYPRLILCRQIKRFNHLLMKQAAVMNQMKHGDELAMSNGTHMQQMHQLQHPIPTFNAGPSEHLGMQYTCSPSAFDHSSSMWLYQNPNQVAFAPESDIPHMNEVQHPVPEFLPQTTHSEWPHAYPSDMLFAQIPNNGIPPVFDYPCNTMLVQNMDGGMIHGMDPPGKNSSYLVPTYLPEPGCAICGRSPMEHAYGDPCNPTVGSGYLVPTNLPAPGCATCAMENAYGDPFNTLLDQNPNVGIMQGMNNEMIPDNNDTTSLGNYGHQIGNSGVQLQTPLHQLSIPSPPPVRNEPCSPGDQHSSNRQKEKCKRI